ncbi:class I SAM-dependent methyltransferase [Algihabitans albus]|uniref:class I SAM-dependent methyltransferase n=1 Tax=Algihabitans albus TaxID=2164067 RepID=UPI000E5D4646|nr:SAM-dependent methyltransferase [Algihabitans albus]
MTPLGRRLARRIRTQGSLSVAEYMTACLFDPAEGVYTRADPLGREGHFTTAPEISQMFGELLGLWAGACWQAQGRPARCLLIELGPGRGTLMADALRALALLPAFLEAAEVVLIEASPGLRAVQERALAGRVVRWADSLDDLPEAPIFLLANEFFDALPIRQYLKTPEGWAERRVGLDEAERLRWGLSTPLPGHPPGLTPAKQAAPVGALVETCTAGETITGEIGRRLRTHGGAALAVDYGYHPSTAGETFQALARHKTTDPLSEPGRADLTAHVDFEALATASGATAHGPVDQGRLLQALGIEARAQTLKAKATPQQAADIDIALRRLTAPDQMGRLFKALALTAEGAPAPPGFPA